MKALIISADNFEDSELLIPYYRLKEAGVEVAVASLSGGVIKGKHGYEVDVDKTLDEVNPDDYASLILPEGAAAMCGIKEVGGITIAQRLDTAAQPDMPESAIKSGCIDLILSPENIAKEIVRIAHAQ